jgi:CheY-like chemotaxis protein
MVRDPLCPHRVRKNNGNWWQEGLVALTSHTKKGDRQDYLAAGMDACLSKPIRGRELYAVLAPFLAVDEVGEEPIAAARA